MFMLFLDTRAPLKTRQKENLEKLWSKIKITLNTMYSNYIILSICQAFYIHRKSNRIVSVMTDPMLKNQSYMCSSIIASI